MKVMHWIAFYELFALSTDGDGSGIDIFHDGHALARALGRMCASGGAGSHARAPALDSFIMCSSSAL